MKHSLNAAVKKVILRTIKSGMKRVYPGVPWREENRAMQRRFDPDKVEYALNTSKRDTPLVVSFTTIPSRIDKAIYVADSMLSQTTKPDKVLLYLAEDEFPDRNLPAEYQNLIKRGLEIDYVENLKPHKKYYFALRDYLDAAIITVDDDIIYPLDLVETLCDSYKRFPEVVSAMRAHRMRADENGLLPYLSWELSAQEVERPSAALFATTGGGTLFPPHSLPQETLNKEVFTDLCLHADDVWIKAMLLLHNTPVVLAKSGQVFPTIADTRETALMYENTAGGKNDEYIEQVFSRYHLLTPEFLSLLSGSGQASAS